MFFFWYRLQLNMCTSRKHSVICAHLHSLSTEHVLMQDRDDNFSQILDMLFCFLAAALYTAGQAFQGIC